MALIPHPIVLRVFGIEHVEVHGRKRGLGLDDEAAEIPQAAARGAHLDGFEVGKHHHAVVGARLLFTEKKLSGARLERIIAALENAAHDDLRQLVDEQRRNRDVPSREDLQVAGFETRRAFQSLEEGEQQAVVVTGVRVLDALERLRLHVAARVLEKRLVQLDFVRTGLLDGPDLRTHQVSAEKIVRDGKPPVARALE
ncbi:MAG: hypothetical protein E6H80_01885 [Betaproteobacteria bacterium]|nr:MAG: hypothetical protein E6H80_01885 [Betaproteobacteria bacterium]